jgi:hypothetical protein
VRHVSTAQMGNTLRSIVQLWVPLHQKEGAPSWPHDCHGLGFIVSVYNPLIWTIGSDQLTPN